MIFQRDIGAEGYVAGDVVEQFRLETKHNAHNPNGFRLP